MISNSCFLESFSLSLLLLGLYFGILIEIMSAAEYARMVDAYSAINQKLQNFISEKSSLEKTIQELKVFWNLFVSTLVFIVFSRLASGLITWYLLLIFQADLRMRERDYYLAQKEISDLQKQVCEGYPNVGWLNNCLYSLFLLSKLVSWLWIWYSIICIGVTYTKQQIMIKRRGGGGTCTWTIRWKDLMNFGRRRIRCFLQSLFL